MADQVAGEPGQDESQVKELVRATLGLNETEYEGDKVGIAVIDSGLEKSGDLGGGRADRFFDFTTDGRSGNPYDDYGHGTHVATLIAGEGKESERDVEIRANGRLQKVKVAVYRGVAPKARIISLKVLDANGAGYTSSVLRALEFAIENRDKLDIDVINLSLGHPIYESPETDPLVRAVGTPSRLASSSSRQRGTTASTRQRGWSATPASRRREMRRQPSPLARSTCTGLRIAAMTPCRITAHADRPGIQGWPNPISWHRAIVSWPSARTKARCISSTPTVVSWAAPATRRRAISA
jgi:hypothetical protein